MNVNFGDQRKDERCASAGNVGGDLVAGVGRCVCTRSVGFAGLRLVARRLARGDEQQRGQRERGGAEDGRVHVGYVGWRVAPAWVQIGRASCREGVCRYVSISVVAVSLKKKRKKITPE